MSITNLVSPLGRVCVQDDLWYIATSDNATQTDFKYVFDVFDFDGNQLIRTKIYPEPSNYKGYFNVSQVIRNEMKFNWFTPVTQTAIESFLYEPNYLGQIASQFQIQVGEDFGGVTTLNLEAVDTIVYNYFPTLFNRRDNQPILSNDIRWNTNRPLKGIIGSTNEKLLVPFKNVGTDLIMRAKGYDSSGTLIYDATSPYTFQPTNNGLGGADKKEFVQLDIGLNSVEITCDDFMNINQLAYYDVFFDNNLSIPSFRVYKNCDKYEVINLYFINAYGMFDTARFGLVSKLNLDIERKTFSKRDYRLNSVSVDYKDANDVYVESKINYGSKINWKYKLTMDFPSDEEYQWLYELIVSPQIYAKLEDGYYPVSIVNTNYEYSKYEFNRLKAFEIEIELNQPRFGYRR